MTYLEMQDEVLFNSFDALKFRSRIKRWLNDGVNELCRRVGLMKIYEVCAYDSAGVVTFVQRFHTVQEVWVANGPIASTAAAVAGQSTYRLAPMPYASPVLAGTEQGLAGFYIVEHAGNTTGPGIAMRIVPHAASGFVSVTGKGTPAPMSTDASTSGIGQEFDEILIAFARSRAFRAEDDFEAAREYMADFDRGIRYASMAKRAHQDGPDLVGGMWSDETPFTGGG